MTSWFPIASEHDVVPRHVFHAQLHGYELAVWRADDGYVNVWENRCLHRGVRLTIGVNDGAELLCRYHGWRYANRSAGCTYIPAHPADAPARTITNRTFASVERYGLIWTTVEEVAIDEPGKVAGEPPLVEALEAVDGTELLGLRNLPVDAPATEVVEALANYRFVPSNALGTDVDDATFSVSGDDDAVTISSELSGHHETVVFFVQPVDHGRAVVRPVLVPDTPLPDEIAVLRHHADRLRRVVALAESQSASVPSTAGSGSLPALEEVPVHVRPAAAETGRQPQLQVVVHRKWFTAHDVAAFELAAVDGSLPTFQPGAHIDVHLPNGLVRQYSLTNAPGESQVYRIGVQLDPESAGGSTMLHDVVREGDVLEISAPRNNFALRRDREHTLLFAGGIGITPLLSMAQALDRNERSFSLHCFVRDEARLAFPALVDGFGASAQVHAGLSPEASTAAIKGVLAAHDPSTQIYVCGPPAMLDTVRTLAADLGWPEHDVHFEYFANAVEFDTSSAFEVALSRSAITFDVAAGTSILVALAAHGVAVPSSCEKGACGTCEVTVIEGTPEHNDVYLSASERAANASMMVCVSRAASGRLVLDL